MCERVSEYAAIRKKKNEVVPEAEVNSCNIHDSDKSKVVILRPETFKSISGNLKSPWRPYDHFAKSLYDVDSTFSDWNLYILDEIECEIQTPCFKTTWKTDITLITRLSKRIVRSTVV